MIQVVCAIIMKEDKILIAQRSERMKLPLKWEFPGGKLEDGEKEEEALIREIQEELNIDIIPLKKISSHIHDYGSFKINLIAYLCEISSGIIRLLEHIDYRYISLEEISNFELAPADIPVLNKLRKYLNKPNT